MQLKQKKKGRIKKTITGFYVIVDFGVTTLVLVLGEDSANEMVLGAILRDVEDVLVVKFGDVVVRVDEQDVQKAEGLECRGVALIRGH